MEPESKESRSWWARLRRWWPGIVCERYRDQLELGIGTLYCERTLVLVLNPRRWRIEQDHTYYDGPHCWYQFGPFAYRASWNWCKKCMPDD